MVKQSQAGFTLIELILVMAISSSLAVIAFMGQSALRSQAQFDAAVNKLVATVSDARNEATAGVNVVGAGDGSGACPGAGSGQYVFGGVAWSADNSLPGNHVKMEFYRTLPGSAACVFETRPISLPVDVAFNAGKPRSEQGGRMLFVRTDTGGLSSCPMPDLSLDAAAVFKAGGCAAGSLTLNVSDASGHTSAIVIDQSGLAKRQF